MPSSISIHFVSFSYMVTLFAVVGWGLICWEAQLAADAARAPVAIAATK